MNQKNRYCMGNITRIKKMINYCITVLIKLSNLCLRYFHSQISDVKSFANCYFCWNFFEKLHIISSKRISFYIESKFCK